MYKKIINGKVVNLNEYAVIYQGTFKIRNREVTGSKLHEFFSPSYEVRDKVIKAIKEEVSGDKNSLRFHTNGDGLGRVVSMLNDKNTMLYYYQRVELRYLKFWEAGDIKYYEIGDVDSLAVWAEENMHSTNKAIIKEIERARNE